MKKHELRGLKKFLKIDFSDCKIIFSYLGSNICVKILIIQQFLKFCRSVFCTIVDDRYRTISKTCNQDLGLVLKVRQDTENSRIGLYISKLKHEREVLDTLGHLRLCHISLP